MDSEQIETPKKRGKGETPSWPETSSTRTSDGTESVGLSTIPPEEALDVKAYRETDEGKKLAQWVLSEFEKAASARTQYDREWRTNLYYYRRQQGLGPNTLLSPQPSGASPDQAKRRRKLRINRIRAFARTEHSKFVSQEPTVTIVPASSEDQDFRAATAGEQVWRSSASAGFLDTHVSESMWWKVLTGNGFLKTYWDGTSIDPVSGAEGLVRYGSVTPFHLYIPDLREPSIEDQPYIFNGYVKTLEWAKQRFPGQLEGCAPGMLSLNRKIDTPVTENITEPPNSVVVLEVWVKPGAHKSLPEGGLLHFVGSLLVGIVKRIPYLHGSYPYTHFSHIYTGAFYRESAINDLIELQDEYNDIRSDINRAARVAGRPQLLAQKGSYTTAKHTNEAGLIIEYNPGFQPPTPMQLSELPTYVQAQQDRILADFEDISGQHEVSRGQAPGKGVTAGTAIAYLQESDDQYLTPQYRADERAFEKVAKQTLELFVQYVDAPRKVKSVGADRAFDTMMLQGADIRNGTDVRVEKGSTISTSQVARRADIKEMVGIGMLSPQQGLELLEIGGAERLKETIDIARSKAQRENIKMQNLTSPELLQWEDAQVQEITKQTAPEVMVQAVGGLEAATELGAEGVPGAFQELVRSQLPAVVGADDFDLHAVHIDAHNQFRMSQAYEQLDDEVKAQFEKHIAMHEQFIMQQQLAQQQAMQGIPQPPDEGGIAETLAAGGMTLPAPGAPEPTLGEPGEDPSRADQFKAGVAPQTPGV